MLQWPGCAMVGMSSRSCSSSAPSSRSRRTLLARQPGRAASVIVIVLVVVVAAALFAQKLLQFGEDRLGRGQFLLRLRLDLLLARLLQLAHVGLHVGVLRDRFVHLAVETFAALFEVIQVEAEVEQRIEL